MKANAAARRHPSLLVGALLVLLLLCAAALSFVWTPWSPYEMDLAHKLQTPNAQHWRFCRRFC